MIPRRRLILAPLLGLAALLLANGRGGVVPLPRAVAAPLEARPACTQPPAPGFAQCLALVQSGTVGAPTLGGGPATAAARPADVLGDGGAYDPSYLQSAYNLAHAAAVDGYHATIAVVDAFDNPTAESDLAYYRATFGLPPCSAASHCFTKLDQNGGANYPPSDPGWTLESALDLDMASAICPNCRLVLVEATDNSFVNLAQAAALAGRLPGVAAVSNGYGGPEFPGENTLSAAYRHPGVAFTVSAGDDGYGVEFPAALPDVTAVGGTTLYQATNTGSRQATETAWSGTGSGCSTNEAQPPWQDAIIDHRAGVCNGRVVADVAADADPATPVWGFSGATWYWFAGTSVGAPLIAATYALAASTAFSASAAANLGIPKVELLYEHRSALFDITSGSNGTCAPAYLCTAGRGYDGPTGLGTPNGVTAFRANGPR